MRTRSLVIGQPRRGRPALKIHLAAGQPANHVLATHFTRAGEDVDHHAWQYRLVVGGRTFRPGSGLMLGERPEALVLLLSAEQVAAFGTGRRHRAQLWIDGPRRGDFPWYDERASYLVVEDRNE